MGQATKISHKPNVKYGLPEPAATSALKLDPDPPRRETFQMFPMNLK